MKVIAATTLAQMALAITVDKSTVPALIADNTGCTDADKGLSCYEDAHCAPCGQKCDLSNKTMAITGLHGEGTCNYGCTADDDCNGFVCSKGFCVPPSDNSGDNGCTDDNKGLGCFEDGHCEHCHQVCDFDKPGTLPGEGTCVDADGAGNGGNNNTGSNGGNSGGNNNTGSNGGNNNNSSTSKGVCALRWPEELCKASECGASCKGCYDLSSEAKGKCSSPEMSTARSCTTHAECGPGRGSFIPFCYDAKTPPQEAPGIFWNDFACKF